MSFRCRLVVWLPLVISTLALQLDLLLTGLEPVNQIAHGQHTAAPRSQWLASSPALEAQVVIMCVGRLVAHCSTSHVTLKIMLAGVFIVCIRSPVNAWGRVLKVSSFRAVRGLLGAS